MQNNQWQFRRDQLPTKNSAKSFKHKNMYYCHWYTPQNALLEQWYLLAWPQASHYATLAPAIFHVHYLKGTCKEPEWYLHQKEPLKTLSITFAEEASWGPAKVAHFKHSSCLQSVTIHIPTKSYQDHIALVHEIFQNRIFASTINVGQ
jgi:hypothetical protein